MLPIAAATLPSARRVLTPFLGAVFATLVVWMMRRSAPDLRLKNKWKPFVSEMADPFLSTAWRTVSSAYSVAAGAAIGREGR